jgi:putative peptidoglycan hydrolase
MIFQGNEIDEALIVNSTVTLTKQTKSTNNIQKTKSEREIDLFIEKAKNDAAKKEEEKLAEEKRKERQREEEEKAQREKERERELERRKEEEEKAQKEQTTPKEPQVQDVSQKAPAQTLLASGITVDGNEVTNFSKTLLGVPYVWGGTSLDGFDCSGFVQYVYKKYEMDLSRTTYTQIKQGKSIALSDIKENDLVFFDTRASSMLTKAKSQGVSGTLDTIIINESDTGNSKKLYPSEPTHVGMYIGNGKMIHASSSKKQVVVEVLENDYFKDRIVDIRRYK